MLAASRAVVDLEETGRPKYSSGLAVPGGRMLVGVRALEDVGDLEEGFQRFGIDGGSFVGHLPWWVAQAENSCTARVGRRHWDRVSSNLLLLQSPEQHLDRHRSPDRC